MTMIVSGAEGLRGKGDLINAKAFEAKIDNAIKAITEDLIVFMLQLDDELPSRATTRPWDFAIPLAK
jgi:hypothetical protein